MPQYPTPQFIEEEGKIVFFLTFRQFFLMVGAGGACLLLYSTLPFWIFVAISLPIILLAIAIAFIKIENESIIQIVMHFIGFSVAKKHYIWKKGNTPYLAAVQETPQLGKVHNVKKLIETRKK